MNKDIFNKRPILLCKKKTKTIKSPVGWPPASPSLQQTSEPQPALLWIQSVPFGLQSIKFKKWKKKKKKPKITSTVCASLTVLSSPPWAGLEIPQTPHYSAKILFFFVAFFLFFWPIHYLAANLLFFIIHISLGWLLGRKLWIITALAARAPKSDWDIEPCKLYSHLETKRMFSLKRHIPTSPSSDGKRRNSFVVLMATVWSGRNLSGENCDGKCGGGGGGKVTFRNTLMLQHSDHFRPHMSFQSGISGKFNLLTKFK